MNNLNSLIIEGIVESNPVITISKKGTPICSFTLISKRMFKEDGVLQEDTVTVTIETWARLAELCGEHCTKGRSIRIVGRLKQNMTNGNVGVIAEHIGFKPIAKNRGGIAMAFTFEEWEKGYYDDRPVEPCCASENPELWAEIVDYAEDKLKESFDAGYQSCCEEYKWHFLKDGDFPPQDDKKYLFYFDPELVDLDTWRRKKNNKYVVAWAEFQTPKGF